VSGRRLDTGTLAVDPGEERVTTVAESAGILARP